MATFHMQINTGGKGEAAEHGLYIGREGRFTEEKYGVVQARGVGNLPEWARGDTQAFWKASDEFERSNGNTYREYELALPRELSHVERVALVERYVAQELGTARPYQWAIHHAIASDGKEQPHVHVMFSDRQQDGIERGPEQFFKRYNSKHPERGGCQKATYWDNKVEAAVVYEKIRERWANVQNQALEMAGVEARVDHRSLAAQGIRHREPQRHRGPAVSGIEARGEVSHVGRRQREQREYRIQKRAAVVAEVRVVTREEMALERVAVRERRELARGVTGEDRALVMPLVEADRREQLGRAQAAAERRVERRQGLGIGEIQEKLVAQARALRERIGQQLGRVKAWVAERFPEPLERLKERSRAVFEAVAKKARGAREQPSAEAERAPDRAPPGDQKRGMFDGLRLRAERSAASAERAVSPSDRPSVARESSPRQVRDQAAKALNQSVDRYARAWMDAWRMRVRDLPVLEHQKTELKHAGEDLDQHRPGARQDLHNALRHEPSMVRIMTELEGTQRSRGLLAGLEQEERIRRDPTLRAERLVKEWSGLEAQRKEIKGWEHSEARDKVKGQMRELAREFKLEPQLELAVKRRAQALGIDAGSRLGRVLQEKDLERALSIAERDLGRGRGLSR